MEILTSFLLYVIRLGISYSTLKSFSQYSNFQMFSNDILRARMDTKSVTEKTVTNLNLNFNFFETETSGHGLSGTMLTLL